VTESGNRQTCSTCSENQTGIFRHPLRIIAKLISHVFRRLYVGI
jgi:hypothetical protein